MEEAPWPPQRVREALQRAREADASFHSGQILGSMCTAPHPLAAEAHAMFLETNLGDPGHFPGTARLERELLHDLAGLVHGPPAGARLLTGGTEANLLACAVARGLTGARRIIAPDSAHFSFDKAARLLQMELVRVPTQDHRADPAAMAEVAAGAALLVGVAGTTELGLVDPIGELGEVARDAGIPLHVDAAFGGYVLPFLAEPPPFALDVPGVSSVGIDPHKMGMAPIPGGALILAEPAQWDLLAVETGYVSTESQSTLMGTRPGASAAAAWAVHRSLGRRGYRHIVSQCMLQTRRLAEGLVEAGAVLVAPPELNVVTFRLGDTAATAASLAAAGFRLNTVPRHDALRVVVNPHVTAHVVEAFLAAVEAEVAHGP